MVEWESNIIFIIVLLMVSAFAYYQWIRDKKKENKDKEKAHLVIQYALESLMKKYPEKFKGVETNYAWELVGTTIKIIGNFNIVKKESHKWKMQFIEEKVTYTIILIPVTTELLPSS